MKILRSIAYSIIIFSLCFIVIEYGVNKYFQDYQIEFSNDNINYDNISNKEYWSNIIIKKGYELSEDIYDTSTIIISENSTILKIDGKGISYQEANNLLRALLNDGVSSQDDDFISNYSTETLNRTNPIIIPIIISIISFIMFMFILKKVEEPKYKILSKEYWSLASKESKVVRNLCTMSLILSLQIVIGLLPIPSGFGELKIGFSYLFQAINCLLFGPINGLMIGAMGDIIGHFLQPSGPFFLGYTLNAMIPCFVYGLCFYKTKITFSKVLLARIIVNFFVNSILGTLWSAMMFNHTFDMAMTNFLYINLPKNIFYLIPQSLVLFIVLKHVVKVFYHYKYIEEYQTKVTII